MTGYACERKVIHNKLAEFSGDKEALWEELRDMQDRGCLMGCSRAGGTEHGLTIDGEETGIFTGHAYGLNKVFYFYDEDMENPRKTHRLVLVRNPWGANEWQLKWSSNSEQMDTHRDALQKLINEMEEDERFDMDEEDGLFFMNFKSFRTVFDRIFIAQNFPDEWWCIRYESEWIPDECSGGLPKEGTAAACLRYAENPQYMIQPTETDCEIFVSLGQNDGRLKTEDGQFYQYPFKEALIAGDLTIWQLDDGETKLMKYQRDKILAKNGPVRASSNAVRTKLKKGKTYVIVPSPMNANTYGKFYLSIYLSCNLHDVNIERIGKPTERCKSTLQL